MNYQLAAGFTNRNIELTNNASSQTQDGNCFFELAPDYIKGNRRVH